MIFLWHITNHQGRDLTPAHHFEARDVSPNLLRLGGVQDMSDENAQRKSEKLQWKK